MKNIASVILMLLAILLTSSCDNKTKKFTQKWALYNTKYPKTVLTIEPFQDNTVLFQEGEYSIQNGKAEQLRPYTVNGTWIKLDDGRYKITLKDSIVFAAPTDNGLSITAPNESIYSFSLYPDAVPYHEVEADIIYHNYRYSKDEEQKKAFEKIADDGHIRAMHVLAWKYSTRPAHINKEKALSYAKKSYSEQQRILKKTMLDSDASSLAYYAEVLAAAYAQNGDFDSAISVQKDGIDLYNRLYKNPTSKEFFVNKDKPVKYKYYTNWKFENALSRYQDGLPIEYKWFNGTWKQAPNETIKISGSDYTTYNSKFHRYEKGRVYYLGYDYYIFIDKQNKEARIASLSPLTSCTENKLIVANNLFTKIADMPHLDYYSLMRHQSAYPVADTSACFDEANLDASTTIALIPIKNNPLVGFEPIEEALKNNLFRGLELALYRYAFTYKYQNKELSHTYAKQLVRRLEQKSIPQRKWPLFTLANSFAVGGDFKTATRYLNEGIRYKKELADGLLAYGKDDLYGQPYTFLEAVKKEIKFYETWSDLFAQQKPFTPKEQYKSY